MLLLLLSFLLRDALRCVWTPKLIGAAIERHKEQKQTDLFNYGHIALQDPILDPFAIAKT